MRLGQVASRGEGPHCPYPGLCRAPMSHLCLLPQPSLLMEWLQGAKLRLKRKLDKWKVPGTNTVYLFYRRDAGAITPVSKLQLTNYPDKQLWLSFGRRSWGPNGSHQWVADFRHHKFWVSRVYWIYYEYLKPQVPHVYLVSHKYLMPLGLSSLSVFSTHMLSLLYLC